MKNLFILFALCASTTNAFADRDNITFNLTFRGKINVSKSQSRCENTYLRLPIETQTLDPADQHVPIDLLSPYTVWIESQSPQHCEALRTSLDASAEQINGSVDTQFSIQGSSRWYTIHIGQGCPSPRCQSYETYAHLSGQLLGLEFTNIFSDSDWINQRVMPPTRPTPPRPPHHRHCHPMDMLCEH